MTIHMELLTNAARDNLLFLASVLTDGMTAHQDSRFDISAAYPTGYDPDSGDSINHIVHVEDCLVENIDRIVGMGPAAVFAMASVATGRRGAVSFTGKSWERFMRRHLTAFVFGTADYVKWDLAIDYMFGQFWDFSPEDSPFDCAKRIWTFMITDSDPFLSVGLDHTLLAVGDDSEAQMLRDGKYLEMAQRYVARPESFWKPGPNYSVEIDTAETGWMYKAVYSGETIHRSNTYALCLQALQVRHMRDVILAQHGDVF